jgi:hypothetical protein
MPYHENIQAWDVDARPNRRDVDYRTAFRNNRKLAHNVGVFPGCNDFNNFVDTSVFD